jgi:hypothetical protein
MENQRVPSVFDRGAGHVMALPLSVSCGPPLPRPISVLWVGDAVLENVERPLRASWHLNLSSSERPRGAGRGVQIRRLIAGLAQSRAPNQFEPVLGRR